MQQNEIPVAQPVSPPPQSGPVKNASSRAVMTLVLGILSITCTGLLTGIPAIILGTIELKAIKAGQAPKEGESSAKIGLILGIVGTLLMVLAIFAFIAIIALGISFGTSGVIHEMMKNSV